jgi:vacuolar-type H+-ATPase subunit E/Vma4
MTTTVSKPKTDTHARVAEMEVRLAVLNEIGEALSSQLDFQSVIDAVGDRLSEVLGTKDLTIAIIDEAAGVVHDYYYI